MKLRGPVISKTEYNVLSPNFHVHVYINRSQIHYVEIRNEAEQFHFYKYMSLIFWSSVDQSHDLALPV
jgi:hypothetical protein